MGVFLDLLVFTFPNSTPDTEARTVIPLERVRKLFKDLEEAEKAKGEVVPDSFRSYFKGMGCPQPQWGKTLRTIYDMPVRTLTVGELMSFAEHPDVTMYPFNQAAWAYLSHLPSEIRVALWWH